MLRVMRAEKLRNGLAGLHDVLLRYERGALTFVSGSLRWLEQAETLLHEERLPEATEVITARSGVLAARERAQVDGASGAARRRRENLAAIDALERTEALLRRRLLAIEEELEGFESKLIEAVTALVVLGGMPDPAGRARPAVAQAVWTALTEQETTRPTAVWLAAALAPPDRQYLLDDILQRLRSSSLLPGTGAGSPEDAHEERV